MDKNIAIGGGLIALGVVLAIRAKRQGKVVPVIGRLIPASPAPAPAKEGDSSFSGMQIHDEAVRRSWDA